MAREKLVWESVNSGSKIQQKINFALNLRLNFVAVERGNISAELFRGKYDAICELQQEEAGHLRALDAVQ